LESGADAYLIQPADPVVLVATVRSLVRLHGAESTARLAAQQWQTTFDALSEGVAIVDEKGVIRRCNRAMTSLLGKTYGEIEGTSLADLLRQCFGQKTEIPEGVRLIEFKAGSRFFRLSFDPIARNQDVPEGGIVIVTSSRQIKTHAGTKYRADHLLDSDRILTRHRARESLPCAQFRYRNSGLSSLGFGLPED